MKIKYIKIFFTVIIIIVVIGDVYGYDNKNNTKQDEVDRIKLEQTEKERKKAERGRIKLEQEKQVRKTQEKAQKLLSFSQYVKKIDEFTLSSDKKTQGYGIYTLNSESGTKYLIKKVDPKQVYADFIGAFILRKIIGDRVPLNYIICNNDGKTLGLASRLIENFTSLYDYVRNGEIISNPDFLKKADELGEKLAYFLAGTTTDNILPRCKSIEKICEKLCYSDILVEANLLANFINQQDYHHSNVGFIVKNGTIVNSALIDFSDSLGFRSPEEVVTPSSRYFGGGAKALKSLNLIPSKFKIEYLDELSDLFDILGERTELNRVKTLIQDNLENLEQQIKACDLFIKITTKTYTAQDIIELINIGLTPNIQGNSIILMNFTSKTSNNDLINLLCQKNDVDNLVKILSADNDIAEAFVNYCLANNAYDLLKTISLKLDNEKTKNLAKKVLGASKTTEHLTMYLELVKNKEMKLKSYEITQLIQTALQYRAIENLAEFLTLLKEVGFTTTYVQDNLENINRQIKVCELLTKITTQDYTQEEFEELITIAKNKTMRIEKSSRGTPQLDAYILSDFTSENGENILINFLCQKEDVDNTVITLSVDIQLMANCVKYCLKHNPEFLKKLVLQLDTTKAENLILETLKNCKTTGHLQIAKDLINKLSLHSNYATLIEDFLNNKLIGDDIIEKLYEHLTNLDQYPDDKGKHEIKKYDIYTQTLDTLVTIWLSQSNVTPLNIKPEKIDEKIYMFIKGIVYRFASEDDSNKIEKYLEWVKNNEELTKNARYFILSEKKWGLFKKLYGTYDKAEIKKIIDNYIRVYPYKEYEEKWILYSLFNISA